jgi:hypothetical protein
MRDGDRKDRESTKAQIAERRHHTQPAMLKPLVASSDDLGRRLAQEVVDRVFVTVLQPPPAKLRHATDRWCR